MANRGNAVISGNKMRCIVCGETATLNLPLLLEVAAKKDESLCGLT